MHPHPDCGPPGIAAVRQVLVSSRSRTALVISAFSLVGLLHSNLAGESTGIAAGTLVGTRPGLEGGELTLSVSPPAPTPADPIEICIGGCGDGSPLASWREFDTRNVPLDRFVVRRTQFPEQARYTLGVLPPGRYTVLLYQYVQTPFSCVHSVVGIVRFAVREDLASGSGRIRLTTSLEDPSAMAELIERENPQVHQMFTSIRLVALAVPPGLEATYLPAVRNYEDEVADARPDRISTIPECSLPLERLYEPGRFWIQFRDDVDYPALVEGFVQELLPQQDLSVATEVLVPPGWEAYFLRRYLDHPEVEDGEILPP